MSENKVQKPHYYLLKAQDLWQAYYQILLMILLKEFIKLIANMDMIRKWGTGVIKYKDCAWYF